MRSSRPICRRSSWRSTGIALPAIPTLAKTYAISFGVASGVVTAFVLGNVVGTIPSGWLIDCFGNRVVLIAAPLLASVTSFAIFFSDFFTELLILRFLTGCAAQSGRWRGWPRSPTARHRRSAVGW